MTEEAKLRESRTADKARVDTAALRWMCDATALDFETTNDIEPLRSIIGQDDALDALRFGLEIFAPGQNVFVRGLTGTGRMSLVRNVLETIQPACPLASDYCYVANFERPREPRLLTLPRARGFAFRDALDRLIEFLTKELEPALNTDQMRSRRRVVDAAFEAEAKAISDPFEAELAAAALTMVSVQVGSGVRPAILPLIDGTPAPPERIQELRTEGKLDDATFKQLEEKIAAFAETLEAVAVRMRDASRKHTEAVRELVRAETRLLLTAECDAIRKEFPTDVISAHLEAIVEDVLRHGVERLLEPGGTRRYRVNVVLGHKDDEPCPIIVENAPTLANLLGTVDRRVLPEGSVASDHLMISAGSLLRADGGYLILEARELLREPGAWTVMMRSLRTRHFEIVPAELGGPWSPQTLKPEPIPLSVKVILIGDPGLYYALDARDADFPHLFKVLADFDSSIERCNDGVRAYAGLFARIALDEGLPAFHRDAIAALAEHGARVAGHNNRLTTQFGRLVDIAREAAFLSSKKAEPVIRGEDVREAIRRGKRRGDLPARKFRKSIAEGVIHVATRGSQVGQVNGMAVIRAGPLVYGFPARITATIGAGHAGVINIEGEAQLSGSIHTKGFNILSGVLRHLLKTQHPLAFSASIAFEQSYGGIDGDSASGAEMCCLLSALTDIPLRQDLAMTGAIDQHGRILPIGGATEKIEGFYDTCFDAGLTGDQGVILPKSNVRDLMLREDLVEACEAGRFHIYAVETIHEALEVFTGVEAGRHEGPDAEYPEGTLLHRAVERAFDFWSFASTAPIWEEAGVPDTPDGKPEAAADH